MPVVVFVSATGRAQRVSLPDEERVQRSVLDAARAGGVPLASSCGGVGVCDACRVTVVAGASGLAPVTDRERSRGVAPPERMACQAVVLGTVTVSTPYG